MWTVPLEQLEEVEYVLIVELEPNQMNIEQSVKHVMLDLLTWTVMRQQHVKRVLLENTLLMVLQCVMNVMLDLLIWTVMRQQYV